MKTELEVFDGRDNRREIMILLQRLGTDRRRAAFLTALARHSRNGFALAPTMVTGPCDPVAAYFMFVSICNELGTSINEAAELLQREVRAG